MAFLSVLISSHLRNAVSSHFMLVWSVCLIAAVIGGIWAGGRSDFALAHNQRRASNERGRLWPGLEWPDLWVAGLFAIFVAFYVAVIFYKEDFAYYDDDQLTDFSVRGVAFAPPIWPSQGRFFPLAFQEFNLLRFVTRSPAGYHFLAITQLAMVLALLFLVLRDFGLRYRLLLMGAAMLAPGFCIAFSGLIYPERNILFFLAILIVCAAGYDKAKNRGYLIGCLIATQFLLYYKETTVVLIAVFALSYASLHFRSNKARARFSWAGFVSENLLSIGMVVLSAVYSVLFRIVLPALGTFSYVSQHQETFASVLRSYLVIDWVAWILLAIFLFRIARSFLMGLELDPLWDSLAAGASAYFLAILALRLISGYYLAPVDLIGLLYLARLSLHWVKAEPGKLHRVAIGLALALIMLHDAAYSSFRTIERKGIISAKSQLAVFLRHYAQTENASRIELFVPYSNAYHLMILEAYLKYKGFDVVSPARGNRSGPEVVLESPALFAGNKCIDYREYSCVHADQAGPGALVVLMPDDNIAMSCVDDLENHEMLLFRVAAPVPRVTGSSWFRLLYAISPQFAATGAPGHWLQLHVFRNAA